MQYSDLEATILALLSLFIGLLAIINDQYRILLSGLFVFILFATIISHIFKRLDKVEKYSIRLKKLEEKLKIHEQLIEIKTHIRKLEKEVYKK